jgi:hypothetical protein
MSTVEMKLDVTKFRTKMRSADRIRDAAMPQLYQHFESITPIDTGNARANTHLTSNRISADYPYASVLDAGRGFRDGQMRGSEQAPDGMSEPTKEFAKKLLPSLIKQIWSKS